jgi:hypothetical protein
MEIVYGVRIHCRKKGFMNLQRVTNPFSILEIANKRKRVYYHCHIRKKGFVTRCKLINPFSVYYSLEIFYSVRRQ